MQKFFYFSIILSIVLSSCTNTAPVQQEKYYFDLISYFETQVDVLNTLNPDVHKVITKNGEREEKTLSDINWKLELMAFTQADINKPSWKDLYAVDTNIIQNGFIVKHTATDKSLTTRSIHVKTNDNNEITKIEISTQPDKKIYFAITHMIYVPGKNYSISTEQNLVLFDKDSFTVNATIIQ